MFDQPIPRTTDRRARLRRRSANRFIVAIAVPLGTSSVLADRNHDDSSTVAHNTAGTDGPSGFDASWSTVDGGGGTSTGGGFTLSVTVGQPDAGTMVGGSYALTGGFWSGRLLIAVPCAADIDGDAIVGFADLLEVLGDWGPCVGCNADISGDGVVDFNDLLSVLADWGPCT